MTMVIIRLITIRVEAPEPHNQPTAMRRGLASQFISELKRTFTSRLGPHDAYATKHSIKLRMSKHEKTSNNEILEKQSCMKKTS